MQTADKQQKGYKGLPMEGIVARWYTGIRRSGSQIEERMLRRRAYTKEQFERLVTANAFGGCEIETNGIGIEVRLKKA